MTTISQENLLGYVKENKLGHDNSQKSNTFLGYYKDNWYGHEFRQGTPPVPPTQYYEISFDTSSPYITNTITPFTVEDGMAAATRGYYGAPNNVFEIITPNGTQQYTMVLADEWTSVTGWGAKVNGVTTPMDSGVLYPITADTEYVPTVTHTVIHRDTQGPCPDGFHIGTTGEWQELLTALTIVGAYDVNYIKTYLKIPDAYYLARSNGTKETRYGTVRMWTSTMDSNTVAYAWGIDENNSFVFQSDKPGNGFSIRPFKDTAVDPFDGTGPTPDEPGIGWTTIVRLTESYNGIYWNETKGIITIRGGSYMYTISDKNLGATNVLDNGLFYQFGNNTGYTYNASPYRTSKPTISSSYGPGNYYTGSFVRVSSGNNWFNGTNNNLWGGVTNGTWTEGV